MIERESKQQASRRCRLAFARVAAPLVIFAAAYGLIRLAEAPLPGPVPAPTAIQPTLQQA